jgi:hypothetical protein
MIVTHHTGEITLETECASDLQHAAETLLSDFAVIHGNGPAFMDGTTVLFGWVLLKIHRKGQVMTVCEPDFRNHSITNHIPAVDVTLTVLRDQHRLVNHLKCPPMVTYYTDSLVIERGCLGEPSIYLERQHPVKENDSGWFIGYKDRKLVKDCGYDSIPAYSLLDIRPELMQVLSLPVKYMAVFHGRFLQSVLDPENTPVWP